MNEVLETIKRRYSCRSFTDEPVAKEQLAAIAEAAIAAPSAVNRQGWRVIVATNPGLLAEMEEAAMAALRGMEDQSAYERIMGRGGKVFYNAPAYFVVPIAENGEMDAGIVAENIALAAESLGLGNVINGMMRLSFMGDKAADFEKRLGFPEGYRFGIAVLVGHAVERAAPHTPDPAKTWNVE